MCISVKDRFNDVYSRWSSDQNLEDNALKALLSILSLIKQVGQCTKKLKYFTEMYITRYIFLENMYTTTGIKVYCLAI